GGRRWGGRGSVGGRCRVSRGRATGECGAERQFKCRSCPRNCKRRARATLPLGQPGKAVTGSDPRARRPAVDSVVARAGCLGAGRIASAPGSGRSPCGAARGTSVRQQGVTDRAVSTDAATVYVRIPCRQPGEPESEPRPGAILAAATAKAAEGSGVVIKPVRCLANCTRGLSAAVRCNGCWTYVFGGLDVACGPALVDGARLLAGATDGIMPWRGRPQPLKRGLIARVPPVNFEELE